MSECKYKPLFSRVIIKREPKKTHGAIIIPENIQKRHARAEGVVIAVGENVEAIKPGEKVIFGKHAGTWLDSTYTEKGEADDGTLFMCQDEDILAIVA